MCHIEINGQSFQPSQNALKQILLIIGPGASIWRFANASLSFGFNLPKAEQAA